MSSSVTIEPAYVADTHAVVWDLMKDKRLSQTAADIFTAARQGETIIILSAIAVAEIYYANQKFHFFSNFARLFRQVLSLPHYQLMPFQATDVLDFDTDGQVPEMHDRIIVGLARRLNVALLTSDAAIVASGLARVVW
jgi:PIN domain nuclease of toxin-antitoxin system